MYLYLKLFFFLDNFRKEFRKIIFCNKKNLSLASKPQSTIELARYSTNAINNLNRNLNTHLKPISKSMELNANNVNHMKLLYDEEVHSLNS